MPSPLIEDALGLQKITENFQQQQLRNQLLKVTVQKAELDNQAQQYENVIRSSDAWAAPELARQRVVLGDAQSRIANAQSQFALPQAQLSWEESQQKVKEGENVLRKSMIELNQMQFDTDWKQKTVEDSKRDLDAYIKTIDDPTEKARMRFYFDQQHAGLAVAMIQAQMQSKHLDVENNALGVKLLQLDAQKTQQQNRLEANQIVQMGKNPGVAASILAVQPNNQYAKAAVEYQKAHPEEFKRGQADGGTTPSKFLGRMLDIAYQTGDNETAANILMGTMNAPQQNTQSMDVSNPDVMSSTQGREYNPGIRSSIMGFLKKNPASQPSATTQPAATTQKTVLRKGKLNGKTVIQYSDGTTSIE